jgi:hypothetical protein
MGYELEAVIAAEPMLRAATGGLIHARVVELDQGFALLPMTDDLWHEVSTAAAADNQLAFSKLPAGFADTLARWSARGPIAYVEADIWGGVGTQRAAVWRGGALVLGPLFLPERHPIGPEGTALSQALRELGADRAGEFDEFDAVGLGRHRHTEDWRADRR